ncbi:hypothetical protein SAMN05216436_11998 [bacterium A37T11]|nr:hypothetical protein SAMN05216436_11998 [bacterium A37T11]
MKTIIHNSAHKHIRIPEHTYIIRHAGQSYGWQNINLNGPRLNNIFNHLIHCIMKRKRKVSETVPAGEVAVENVILFNHSNLNKMSTTKKVSSKLLVFGMAFLMAMNVGFAKEQTAKSNDATEMVSVVKEVKPVEVVSAGLENGPGKETKDSLKSDVKVPLKSALVKLNTGTKQRAASRHYLTKNGKAYVDVVWFPALAEGTNCDPSNFDLQNGTLAENPPSGCEDQTDICCAISYPQSSCEEVPGHPGQYRVKSGMSGTSLTVVHRSAD